MRRLSSHHSGTHIGWIALTDLMMLLAVLSIVAGWGLQVSLRERDRRNQLLTATLQEVRYEREEQRIQLNRLSSTAEELLSDQGEASASYESLRRGEAELRSRVLALSQREQTHTSRIAELQSENQRLGTEAVLTAEQVRDYEARMALLASEVEKLRSNAAGEGEIRKELLGITSRLDRVVFILDCSGSMLSSKRWEWTTTTACRWVELLPVKEAAIIVFNDSARSIPADRRLLPMTAETRALFLDTLRQEKPEGLTNTMQALRMAIEDFEAVDSIILFTDGKPEEPKKDSAKLIRAVQEYIDNRLRKKEPTPVINVIGLGNYFDPQLSTFLLSLSSATGGAFIGR